MRINKMHTEIIGLKSWEENEPEETLSERKMAMDMQASEKRTAQRVPLTCVVRTTAGERRMRVLKVTGSEAFCGWTGSKPHIPGK